jgi:hypothetical protein
MAPHPPVKWLKISDVTLAKDVKFVVLLTLPAFASLTGNGSRILVQAKQNKCRTGRGVKSLLGITKEASCRVASPAEIVDNSVTLWHHPKFSSFRDFHLTTSGPPKSDRSFPN